MAKKEQSYYFEVISPEKAKDLHKEGKDIYKLFDNDFEARIVRGEKDLHDAIDLGIELAIKNLIR